MKIGLIAVLLFASIPAHSDEMMAAKKVTTPVLVIHGGAGTILRSRMTPELEREYRDVLGLALRTGMKILTDGGSSLDAVEAAVRAMEDSPLFNAGKGAVFTHEGRNELDASIMDGATRRAGAVAGITILRNPISAARMVMDHSPHVMLTGRGAELFATGQGADVVDPSYFWTERRWKQLQEQLTREKESDASAASTIRLSEDHKFGTVGAVALDRGGNLAAATSTGGMTNKRFGRVGDSPIIGAGTYADNDSCAISATGHGEFFIRFAVAHEICARVKHGRQTLREAATAVIMKELKDAGGDGGVIALDRAGNIVMIFNTEGMYRGSMVAGSDPEIQLYRN